MLKLKLWFMENKPLAIAGGLVLGLFLLMRIIKPGTRRRRLRPGTRRYSTKRFPTRRATKRVYTKGGKAKKPWQVKGSLAAKRHMAQIRKMR